MTFELAQLPVVFSATGTGSGPITVHADVIESTLLLGGAPSYLPALPPGQSYLWIEFQTAEGQVPDVPLALPMGAGTLVTTKGTVPSGRGRFGPGIVENRLVLPGSRLDHQGHVESDRRHCHRLRQQRLLGELRNSSDDSRARHRTGCHGSGAHRLGARTTYYGPELLVAGPSPSVSVSDRWLNTLDERSSDWVVWRRRRAFYRGRSPGSGDPSLVHHCSGAQLTADRPPAEGVSHRRGRLDHVTASW